jgi:hypothetical protein
MKTYYNVLSIIILMSFSLFSCKEEPIGQYSVDDIPPQPIINPTVTNFAGGSRIDYQLPDETDLLYVKVAYPLPNGDMAEVRTSVFANHVELKGFAKSKKTTVQLYCVDRSRNMSQPVDVEIKPEDSPIYDIYRSLKLSTGFGGFKLDWENPLTEDIAVEVMKKDEEGVFKPVETFYSSEKIALNKSVRGQDPVESEFAIYVRDTYNNNSDTLKAIITPWYEIELDKKKWLALPKSNKFTLHSFGNANMSIMWDGVYNVENGIYYISENTNKDEPYFTFDLGTKSKLSRFKYWTRYAYIFKLHSPKTIAILGTNDPAVAANPDSDESEWTLMGEFESTRPSGLPGGVDATAEDRAYADAGEEFEFSLEAPEVRYIRFLSRISWTKTRALFIAELTFWGAPEE